jgi:hypothetical protein
MHHTYFLHVSAHLQLSHYLTHSCQNFHSEFSGITGNQQLGIMFRIEHFGFGGIEIVGMIETDHFFFQTMIKSFAFHVIRALVGVSEKKVCGLRAKVIEVQSSNMLHVVIVVINEIDNIDKAKSDPPVYASQIPSCKVATEVDSFISLFYRLRVILHLSQFRQKKLLLLIRFHHVHLFIMRVNSVENLLVVSRNTQIQDFFMQIERRITHDWLRSVENFRIERQFGNEERVCPRVFNSRVRNENQLKVANFSCNFAVFR